MSRKLFAIFQSLSILYWVFQFYWLGRWRRQWVVVLNSSPQLDTEFRMSLKFCLTLYPWRWLRPNFHPVINLIPLELWKLNVASNGIMKCPLCNVHAFFDARTWLRNWKSNSLRPLCVLCKIWVDCYLVCCWSVIIT